jgi:hypothetical protein
MQTTGALYHRFNILSSIFFLKIYKKNELPEGSSIKRYPNTTHFVQSVKGQTRQEPLQPVLAAISFRYKAKALKDCCMCC